MSGCFALVVRLDFAFSAFKSTGNFFFIPAFAFSSAILIFFVTQTVFPQIACTVHLSRTLRTIGVIPLELVGMFAFSQSLIFKD